MPSAAKVLPLSDIKILRLGYFVRDEKFHGREIIKFLRGKI